MSKGNPIINSMRGKLGAYVYYVAGGEMRQRSYRGRGEVSNPRTRAQQEQRSQLANLVAFYRSAKELMQKAFENKEVNQSDYNAFVSLNLNKTKVYLGKEEASQGACIVAPYIVAKGTLQPVEVTQQSDGNFATNLQLGTLQISETTTVAQLSQALVANNQFVEYGMQLTYASFVQMTNNDTGYPYMSTRLYELTLDASSALLARDQIPEFGLSVVNNAIGTGPTLAAGGFAYILSQKDSNGKLLVSTQRLIISDDSLLVDYNTTAAATRAIGTYGSTTEIFLNPESVVAVNAGEGGGTAVGTSVNTVSVAGTQVTNGGDAPELETGQAIVITGNGLASAELTLYSVAAYGQAETSQAVTPTGNTSTRIQATVPAALNGRYLTGIGVNGIRYTTYEVQNTSMG